ncbi:MAG: cell division protein SepF [Cyanobacteria bacterium]|nr:cell division protein SepF [Cyanobacteriota bacterium]
MNAIFSKLRDFVGLGDPYGYDEVDGNDYVDSGDYQDMYREERNRNQGAETLANRRTSRPVSVPSATAASLGQAAVAGSRAPESRMGSTSSSTMSNVIGMPGAVNGISEVVVMEPKSFEEMPQAIQALRERKSVVLNLTMMDPDQAQRSVDFIAGGTYALDGHQERIGESIFLFTPSCVQVSTQSGVVREVLQSQLRANPQSGAAWGAAERFQQTMAQ